MLATLKKLTDANKMDLMTSASRVLHLFNAPWRWRVVIAQSVQGLCYGRDDCGSRIRFPEGAGDFSLHTASRTALGSIQPPIQWGTRVSFPGGKTAGMWS